MLKTEAAKTSHLFGWLVEYCCQVKWPAVANFVQDGVFYDPFKGRSLKPSEENAYGGLLLVANGDTFNQWIQNEIIDPEIKPEFKPAQTLDQLVDTLELNSEKDGAFFYDGKNKQLAHIGLINREKLASQNYNLQERLPPDFICKDAAVPLSKDRYGSRTDISIKVSQGYEAVDVFQIKETGYTPLGMGLVTHFKKGTLIETFHLEHLPEGDAFIDQKHKVVGIYRRYVDDTDQPVRNEKGEPIPYLEMKIDDLAYLNKEPKPPKLPTKDYRTETSSETPSLSSLLPAFAHVPY